MPNGVAANTGNPGFDWNRLAAAFGGDPAKAGQPGIAGLLSSPGLLGLAQGIMSGSTDQYGNSRPFAQAFGQGLLSSQNFMEAAAKRKFLEEQAKNKQEELRLKQLSEARKAQQQEAQQNLFANLLGGGSGAGMAPTASVESIAQGVQAGGLLSNINPEERQIAGLLGSLDPKSGLSYLAKASAEAGKSARPTQNTITNNQKTIQAIDNVLPEIDSLIGLDVPFQFPGYLGGLSRIGGADRQADYEAKLSEITDVLASAFNLPSSEAGLKTVETMIKKHPGESDGHYRDRLGRLKQNLLERRVKAEQVSDLFGKRGGLESGIAGDLQEFMGAE